MFNFWLMMFLSQINEHLNIIDNKVHVTVISFKISIEISESITYSYCRLFHYTFANHHLLVRIDIIKQSIAWSLNILINYLFRCVEKKILCYYRQFPLLRIIFLQSWNLYKNTVVLPKGMHQLYNLFVIILLNQF